MNTNKVTIVTGAGRGIGRAIALRMSRETAILAVGRTVADLESVCAEINSAGGTADFLVGDVADEATATLAVAKAHEKGWVVRNLVCNAGIAKGGPVVSFDSSVWRSMFDVNVHGAFYFAKACQPDMQERREGAITIISSVSGLKGHKNDAAYSATKFALMGLAESLGDELKKHNIVVVPICPGFVDTEMTTRVVTAMMRHKSISKAEAESIIAATNPQGRILQPWELAEAVAYCSTAATVEENGQAMHLTGNSDSHFLELVNWIWRKAAPAKLLYVPISGGSDSGLNFAACARAYPKKVCGIFVGSPDQLRCREWFEAIGPVKYCDPVAHGPFAEIARWAKFQELCIANNAWLVGSRNGTEERTGLYSLASRVATFLPLANIWKSDVMKLCDEIGMPVEITASSRRADPDCGRPAEMSEIPLELIDTFLKVKASELPDSAMLALTDGQIDYLTHVVDQNAFKLSLPTKGVKLSSRSAA